VEANDLVEAFKFYPAAPFKTGGPITVGWFALRKPRPSVVDAGSST